MRRPPKSVFVSIFIVITLIGMSLSMITNSQNKDLSLKSNIDGRRLYEYLLFTNDFNDYAEIKELIISFVDK